MTPKARHRSKEVSLQCRLSTRQIRRLDGIIAAQIQKLDVLRGELRHMDREVYDAGMELFRSEPAFALWLCEPARALDGRMPLAVMREATGRQQVAKILRAIAHGVVL